VSIVQQLLAIVVTEIVILVAVACTPVFEASSVPVCFTPVYEPALVKIPAGLALTTTLFAPEAGFAKYHCPNFLFAGARADPTKVIATVA